MLQRAFLRCKFTEHSLSGSISRFICQGVGSKKTYTLVRSKKIRNRTGEKTPTREEQKPVIKIKRKISTKNWNKKRSAKEKMFRPKMRKKNLHQKNLNMRSPQRAILLYSVLIKQDRGKGQTVLAVIKFYSSDKTLAQIKSAFPDSIVSRYGCTADLSFARSHERQRYFIKDEQIITTSDSVKKKLAVTNQWDVSRFNLFLEACKKLGIKITRVEKDLTDKNLFTKLAIMIQCSIQSVISCRSDGNICAFTGHTCWWPTVIASLSLTELNSLTILTEIWRW